MPSKEFPKEDLLEIYWNEGAEYNGLKCISNVITDTTRWSICHEIIFSFEGKFYQTDYSEGATEQQCESPWEYDGDMIKCYEVVPVEKVVTVYERVPDAVTGPSPTD